MICIFILDGRRTLPACELMIKIDPERANDDYCVQPVDQGSASWQFKCDCTSSADPGCAAALQSASWFMPGSFAQSGQTQLSGTLEVYSIQAFATGEQSYNFSFYNVKYICSLEVYSIRALAIGTQSAKVLCS